MRLVFTTTVIAALWLGAATSSAAPPLDPRSAARALAERGYALYEAGKYQEAIDVLVEAERLYHAPTLVFALGQAHARLGKLVEARALYRRVVDDPLAPGAPASFADAQRRASDELASLDKRIPTLQVVVRGAGARGMRVTLDAADIADWDQPRLVNPGEHTVTVAPTGAVGRTNTVQADEGARLRVAFDFTPSPPDAPPRIDVAPPPEPPADAPPAKRPWLAPAIAGFALGAVGAGVGIGAGVSAEKRSSSLKTACGGTVCPPAEQGALSSAKTVATLSTVGFVVGGVGVVAGVVLVAGRPGEARPSAALVFTPSWLGVKGSF